MPKVKMHYQPVLCMHCDNAPCMAACPVEGAIYRRKDGLVIIDPVKCTGCKNCVDACPYKTIYFNEDLNIAQKCTGCAHLLDSGLEGAPVCGCLPDGNIEIRGRVGFRRTDKASRNHAP